jgi:hypothetical protein
MNADLVVDGDADNGGVGESSGGFRLLRGWQELQSGDERRMSFLDTFQFLKGKKVPNHSSGNYRFQIVLVHFIRCFKAFSSI